MVVAAGLAAKLEIQVGLTPQQVLHPTAVEGLLAAAAAVRR
jgi:hypothetical protein